MQQQFYLDKALEQSQERAAFKIAPLRDMWEVRIENGETPYTLIHHLSKLETNLHTFPCATER